MLEEFEEESLIIDEIEQIADMKLNDIKCIFKDTEDSYETVNQYGVYIWDRVDGKPLKEILQDLHDDYTAIPF